MMYLTETEWSRYHDFSFPFKYGPNDNDYEVIQAFREDEIGTTLHRNPFFSTDLEANPPGSFIPVRIFATINTLVWDFTDDELPETETCPTCGHVTHPRQEVYEDTWEMNVEGELERLETDGLSLIREEGRISWNTIDGKDSRGLIEVEVDMSHLDFVKFAEQAMETVEIPKSRIGTLGFPVPA